LDVQRRSQQDRGRSCRGSAWARILRWITSLVGHTGRALPWSRPKRGGSATAEALGQSTHRERWGVSCGRRTGSRRWVEGRGSTRVGLLGRMPAPLCRVVRQLHWAEAVSCSRSKMLACADAKARVQARGAGSPWPEKGSAAEAKRADVHRGSGVSQLGLRATGLGVPGARSGKAHRCLECWRGHQADCEGSWSPRTWERWTDAGIA
jgi:hypothetical protein